MANICDNELHVVTNDPKNREEIIKFFEDEWEYVITDQYDDYIEIHFDSRWCFPEKEMNDLFEKLPNKNDIDMSCLSVEWGCYYCAFHTLGNNGWEYCN
jgi:hypothetical protein